MLFKNISVVAACLSLASPAAAAPLSPVQLPNSSFDGAHTTEAWMPSRVDHMRSVGAQTARSCGTASFYGSHGDGFAWRTMANGRPMNPEAMTTAHPTLPLGTRIRVTNQSNGRSVQLTVSDRGPWSGGRILDLSSGAFARIASHSQGLANVCYTRIS